MDRPFGPTRPCQQSYSNLSILRLALIVRNPSILNPSLGTTIQGKVWSKWKDWWEPALYHLGEEDCGKDRGSTGVECAERDHWSGQLVAVATSTMFPM